MDHVCAEEDGNGEKEKKGRQIRERGKREYIKGMIRRKDERGRKGYLRERKEKYRRK